MKIMSCKKLVFYITYGSFNRSLSFGSPMYSESSWKRILMKILLADVVSSSFNLMQIITWINMKSFIKVYVNILAFFLC